MTTDIIVSLELLENYQPYIDLCEKLESDWMITINDKMKKSEKISAEDYARVKIYGSLRDMPKKLRLALTPKEKKRTTNAYKDNDSDDDSSNA